MKTYNFYNPNDYNDEDDALKQFIHLNPRCAIDKKINYQTLFHFLKSVYKGGNEFHSISRIGFMKFVQSKGFTIFNYKKSLTLNNVLISTNTIHNRSR